MTDLRKIKKYFMIDIILKLRDKKVFKILIPTVLLLANLHMIYLHGRNIKQKGIRVVSIKDVTFIPYNGCRPPKRRRV